MFAGDSLPVVDPGSTSADPSNPAPPPTTAALAVPTRSAMVVPARALPTAVLKDQRLVNSPWLLLVASSRRAAMFEMCTRWDVEHGGFCIGGVSCWVFCSRQMMLAGWKTS